MKTQFWYDSMLLSLHSMTLFTDFEKMRSEVMIASANESTHKFKLYLKATEVKIPIIVDSVITYTLSIGAVRRKIEEIRRNPQKHPSKYPYQKHRTYRRLKVCIYFWNLL